MIESLINNPIVLYLLIAIVVASIIWHIIENRWDRKIFDKDRKGVFKNIHAKGALYAMDHVEGIFPIDIRPEKEFNEGHIPGAINAPWQHGNLDASAMKSLDRESPILLYCSGGFASRRAINSMKKLGFHHIYHLHRGFKSWRFFGGAVECPEEKARYAQT